MTEIELLIAKAKADPLLRVGNGDYNKKKYQKLKENPKAFAEWREKMKQYTHNAKEKRKAATGITVSSERLEKQKALAKEWYKKKMQDPEYAQKRRDKNKEWAKRYRAKRKLVNAKLSNLNVSNWVGINNKTYKQYKEIKDDLRQMS